MRSRCLNLALLALLVASNADAGVESHVVSAGESVSSIAEQYYGSYDPVAVMLRFNDRTSHVIHAGETLKIPYCDIHQVKAGETWSGLSQRYAKRPSAYRTIALLNGVSPRQPLQVGQRLVMPVVLPYRLARGDTLASLAERFYGDPALATVLQSFNEIDDARRLSVGQALDIPLVTLHLKKRKKRSTPTVAEAVERSTPTAAPTPKKVDPPAPAVVEAAPRFLEQIEEVRQDFRRAEFDRARERIEALRQPVDAEGTAAEREELLRLQAFVYVAFELPELACDAYRSLLELSPSARMNPQLVSPKIRSTLAACQDA